ncbi:MAG: ABC transporter substrate-binding protein [Firmicutes bacterium]|nr:ABC transporter substrate-binding protein [Bacillota bacterium]
MLHRLWQRRAAIGAGAALALGLSLAGCGQSAAPAGGKTLTIGFVPGMTTDPFFISMQAGAEAEAHKLGVKLLWEGASQYSPSQQTPYVDSLVARGVSALIVAPTDAQAMIPPIRQAVDAHIPVITVDSTINDHALLKSRITSNNVGGGEQAAAILARQIGYHGTVAILSPAPGITTDAARIQGFVAQIRKYPHIRYVGIEYDQEQNTKAATLAQDLVLHHPHLAGIFATDDTSASGAASGLRTAGKAGTVKIVAYDAEPAEVQGLENGSISALIAQKPAIEGQLAVEYAYDLLTGKAKAVRPFVELQNVVLDRANLAANRQWEYRTTP